MAYVPRAKRLELQQQKELQQQQQQDPEQQQEVSTTVSVSDLQAKWKQLQRNINAAVNRVTVENIELVADDLLSININRGRGIFATVICNAQLVSPHLSDVFAALVAKINSCVPEVGDLLLKRLLRQLWQQLKLRRNENIQNTCIFLSHLAMAQVCSVVVILKLLALFLVSSSSSVVSTERILVAAAVFAETYEFLERDYHEAFGAVLEPARQLVEDGQLDARAEEALDGVLKLVRQLQMRKEKEAKSKNIQTQFSSASAPKIGVNAKQNEQQEKNERENKRKGEILSRIIQEAAECGKCHDEFDVDLSSAPSDASPQLDRFPVSGTKDPQELDEQWKKEDEEFFNSEEIKQARLDEDTRRKLEEHVSKISQTQIPRSRTADGAGGDDQQGGDATMLITPNDFTGLADVETRKAREEIQLAFQSSIRSQEIVHKLLGTVAAIATTSGGNQKRIARQQQLIVSIVVQSAIKEKSFDPLYANVADLLCNSPNAQFKSNFEEAFRIAYMNADEYVRKQIGILSSLFAFLIQRYSVDWSCLDVVDVREEAMSPSKRIFLEDLLRELAAAMKVSNLADTLHFNENVAPHVAKMFPKGNKQDSMWAAAFYISINLRPLAAVLMEE